MGNQDLVIGRAWDDGFLDTSRELLFGRKLKKPAKASRPKSCWTGSGTGGNSAENYPGRGSAQDVRARLTAIAKRSRQVVVKISGGGKSTGSIKAHFDYLSRNGELELLDQNGQKVDGREALSDLIWAWKHTGPQMDDSLGTKQAFNIVFSMPQGTNERAVAEAARATGDVEFAGHQWVMVQHHDEPQVHVHICVKAEGLDGSRLNPRKADLQRWRERFAYELRERGVEAEATKRVQRVRQEKINKPWAVTRLEERGEKTREKPPVDPAKAAAWERVEEQALGYYDQLLAALRGSEDRSDRELAAGLSQVSGVAKDRAQRERDRSTEQQLERG